MWDIDGNEYVDVLNGFGMNLFGWQPDFINEAVREQLDPGYEIGPQHPLAGDVTRLLCELTGFDRAGLCNTGSEAVMAALRIARTVTGRNTVVLFTGSYHGTFDEVLVRAGRSGKGMSGGAGRHAGHVRRCARARLRHARSARIHPRATPTTWRRCWSSRCRAAGPTSSRASSCSEVRAITEESRHLPDLRRGHHRLPLRTSAARRRCSACAPTWPATARCIGGGFPVGVIAGKRDLHGRAGRRRRGSTATTRFRPSA